MINKQKLWFVGLFSIVLVLGIYYVTMPSELLKSAENVKPTSKEVDVDVQESDVLAALRVERDEEIMKNMEELESVLTSAESTTEEKSNAFEELKVLNLSKGKEEEIEQKLTEKYKIKSFIKINNDQIKVVVNSSKHDVKLANNIMRSIQQEYDKKMYISVKFQSN